MFEKVKRILALLGVILLVGLYLATFILAFVDPTASKDWLKIAVAATLIIPVLLYGYLLVYRILNKNKKED